MNFWPCAALSGESSWLSSQPVASSSQRPVINWRWVGFFFLSSTFKKCFPLSVYFLHNVFLSSVRVPEKNGRSRYERKKIQVGNVQTPSGCEWYWVLLRKRGKFYYWGMKWDSVGCSWLWVFRNFFWTTLMKLWAVITCTVLVTQMMLVLLLVVWWIASLVCGYFALGIGFDS